MPQQSNFLGSLWMAAAGLLFVAVTIMVRHLGSDMAAVEAAFIRYLFGAILLIPVLLRMRWRHMSGTSFGLYLARGMAHGLAVMLWFFAMARIPIAEVTAISFTTPIFTTIGAVLIFGERLGPRRIGAILIGFLGTLIILRPGFETIEIGSIAQLCAAPCFAISFLFTKRLTHTENAGEILLMLTLFCSLALLPGALLYWRNPTPLELAWLALVAVFATAGHYAITRAIAYAPLTVTQPITFLQLVWAIIFGYLLFDEVPDLWVCAGGAMIVTAISYMVHREAVNARKARLQASATLPI